MLAQHYQHVLKQITQAELSAKRPSGCVQLIAVSKTFPAQDIRELYACGQRDFGENYIQEWREKIKQLSNLSDIQWHIIGNIQSNKTRPVAEYAHWLHTLDRLKIAQRLHEQRPAHLPPLNICIEINIANESAKHGIAPDELLPLAQSLISLERLKLRGLMCVASAHASENVLRQQFNQMADLFEQLKTIAPDVDTLSMGMSSDMDIAIACGANQVRVGTAIFGRRG